MCMCVSHVPRGGARRGERSVISSSSAGLLPCCALRRALLRAALRASRHEVRAARVTAILGGDEGAALVLLDERVRVVRVLREDARRVRLALVERPVAEPERVRVVVPSAVVVRDAVHDLELDLRMVDADRYQLRDVARADPDREAALVERLRIHVADPDRQHFEPVLVGVERAERFAERLGHAVAAVRPGLREMVDRLVAAVIPDRVVGRREHDSFHAVAARRLERVVPADDVRRQDERPVALHRPRAEVNDRVDTLGRAQHVGHLRDVGAHELLALAEILDRLDVRDAQLVAPGELAAEMRADVARGAGDQDGFHRCREAP